MKSQPKKNGRDDQNVQQKVVKNVGNVGPEMSLHVEGTIDAQSVSPVNEEIADEFTGETRCGAISQPPVDTTSVSDDEQFATGDFDVAEGNIDQTDITHVADASAHSSSTGRAKVTAHVVEKTLASRSASPPSTDSEEFEKLARTKSAVHAGPQKIGRYEVQRLLGEGAFGKVYEAHDPQLDRLVAVKVAKSISGATQVKRFLREARAAAQLRHPNIIPVYEYGQVDQENIIVYEFVRGETLKSFIQRKKHIPLSESIEIVKQIASGLHYAHQHGIIHRDMKPDNVLIDSDNHAHIADFGCARSMDDDASLTLDGSILGTPMYMSPEQASGKSNTADGRTDIWSLGVMLYEMVGGSRPFGGGLNDLLYAICNHDAKPLRKTRTDAPADIETICAKCLTRDLGQRFASADLLAEELARYQRGEPILSRRIGTIQRTWLWAKRNRAVASLLATVVITMLIGTTISSSFALQARYEQRTRAIAQLNSLKSAEASALPRIFADLKPFGSTFLPRLYEQLDAADIPATEQRRLRMAIVELDDHASRRDQLADQMLEDLLTADAQDFSVCRDCLEFHKQSLTPQLWNVVLDSVSNQSVERKFRAAAALALYDPHSPNWTSQIADVASFLTSLNPIEMSHWLSSLAPIRESLKPPLVAAFHDRSQAFNTSPERAAAILSLLFTDQPEFLAGLVPAASARQIPLLTEALETNRAAATQQLKTELDKQSAAAIAETANLIIALIQLEDRYQWHQFQMGADPSVVSQLIEQLGPAATPLDTLLPFVQQWKSTDHDLLAGILLSLGQFQPNQILTSQESQLEPLLLDIFSDHPDSRVHASARWLLSHWGFGSEMLARENQLRREHPAAGKNWHVDLGGNTFAIFGPVDGFEMGLNQAVQDQSGLEAESQIIERQHRKQIPRRFGICITEVTIQQYELFENELKRRFRDDQEKIAAQLVEFDAKAQPTTEADSPEAATRKQLVQSQKRLKLKSDELDRAQQRREGVDKQRPVGDVDYFSTLAFCRWLSEQQQLTSGLPTIAELQRMYDRNSGLRLTDTNLKRPGYRIPTATEWEYACRGKSLSLFPFGHEPQMAENYAWFVGNSQTQLHPVGELKPGNTGLFDILGNVNEWCLDWYHDKLPQLSPELERDYYVDFGPEFVNNQSPDRECRGGSFEDKVRDLRTSGRFSNRPINGFPRLGFRLARTYESE